VKKADRIHPTGHRGRRGKKTVVKGTTFMPCQITEKGRKELCRSGGKVDGGKPERRKGLFGKETKKTSSILNVGKKGSGGKSSSTRRLPTRRGTESAKGNR